MATPCHTLMMIINEINQKVEFWSVKSKSRFLTGHPNCSGSKCAVIRKVSRTGFFLVFPCQTLTLYALQAAVPRQLVHKVSLLPIKWQNIVFQVWIWINHKIQKIWITVTTGQIVRGVLVISFSTFTNHRLQKDDTYQTVVMQITFGCSFLTEKPCFRFFCQVVLFFI
jgi:hypothetical protein